MRPRIGSLFSGAGMLDEGVRAAIGVPCDVHGCRGVAVEVLKFREQPGHVHVCGPCGAMDREYCDVVWSGPMPCPWPELDGAIWTDKPRPL